jgi:succinoglycan biosynthesis transport protein ExoP
MSDKYPLSSAVRPIPEYLPSANSSQQQFVSTAVEAPPILTLSEFIRIVRKYRILVVGITLISLTISVLFCLLANPRYTALTTLRISAYEPVLSATRVEDVLSQRSKESNYLETQIREISSLSLADKVLSDQDLRTRLFPPKSSGFWSSLFSGQDSTSGKDNMTVGSSTKEPLSNYNDANYKHSVEKLTAYLARVEVRPLKRTSLVTLSVTTRDPALSADLSNYHARSYIEWVRDSRIEQQSEGLKFLRSQEIELKEKVAALERELADYAEAHSIVAVNKDQNITVQKMAQLNQMLTEAIDKRIQAENIYRESESALNSVETAAVLDDSSVG